MKCNLLIINAFVTANNEVIINEDYATLDAPLHEFGGHLYLAYLKKTDLRTYDKLINLALQETEAVDEILKEYPELANDQEALGDEVFSTMLGLVTQDIASDATLNNWKKIGNIVSESTSILDFFKRMFDFMFGSSDFEFTERDSLIDIMRKIGKDVYSKDSSILNDLSTSELNILKETVDETISFDEIEKKLIDLGYIRKICS